MGLAVAHREPLPPCRPRQTSGWFRLSPRGARCRPSRGCVSLLHCCLTLFVMLSRPVPRHVPLLPTRGVPSSRPPIRDHGWPGNHHLHPVVVTSPRQPCLRSHGSRRRPPGTATHTHARIATALSRVTACTPLRYPGLCAPPHTHPAAAHFVSARPLPPCRPRPTSGWFRLSPLRFSRLRTSRTCFCFCRVYCTFSCLLLLPPSCSPAAGKLWRPVVTIRVHGERARPPIPPRSMGGIGEGGGGKEGRKEGRDCVFVVCAGIRFMKPYSAMGCPRCPTAHSKYTPPPTPTGWRRRRTSLSGPRPFGVVG